MKKIILLTVLLFTMIAASAQKGSMYIGGVIGYSSNTSKDPSDFKTTTSDWAFAPEVGTFLQDDIQLGIFLGISGGSQKNDDGNLYTYSSLSPTIYARKFFPITDEFSAFAGGYLNVSSGSFDDNAGGTTGITKQSGFGLRLGIGVAYALSPRFTAVGQYGLIGFQTMKSTFEGADAGTDSSFDFGVNTVGFSSLSQGNGSGSVFNIGIYYTFKQP
jgi:hypothetical protein